MLEDERAVGQFINANITVHRAVSDKAVRGEALFRCDRDVRTVLHDMFCGAC